MRPGLLMRCWCSLGLGASAAAPGEAWAGTATRRFVLAAAPGRRSAASGAGGGVGASDGGSSLPSVGEAMKASSSSPSIVSISISLCARWSSLSRFSRMIVRASVVGVVDDAPHLVVDLLGDLLGVVALLRDLAAEEDELFLAAEGPRPEALAHTEAGDHGAGGLRHLADVVAGAGGHLAEDDLFGRVAAEHHREHLLQVGARVAGDGPRRAGPACNRRPYRGRRS